MKLSQIKKSPITNDSGRSCKMLYRGQKIDFFKLTILRALKQY